MLLMLMFMVVGAAGSVDVLLILVFMIVGTAGTMDVLLVLVFMIVGTAGSVDVLFVRMVGVIVVMSVRTTQAVNVLFRGFLLVGGHVFIGFLAHKLPGRFLFRPKVGSRL